MHAWNTLSDTKEKTRQAQPDEFVMIKAKQNSHPLLQGQQLAVLAALFAVLVTPTLVCFRLLSMSSVCLSIYLVCALSISVSLCLPPPPSPILKYVHICMLILSRARTHTKLLFLSLSLSRYPSVIPKHTHTYYAP